MYHVTNGNAINWVTLRESYCWKLHGFCEYMKSIHVPIDV